MARSTQWRRTCNDLVFWRQTEALNATIYILRETGPTGFLLKEDGETKTYKVYLGDPHKCSCPQFKKDKDLCKHICWLILKKFRIPQTNPMTWQLGLVEREINEVLRGLTQQQQRQQTQARHQKWRNSAPEGNGRQTIQQREIGENDVCPICQDELLDKHLPVTYCKFGCGNSIHIKCMKIWADHQKTSGESVIKCPFCREDFGPIELLNQENRNASGPVQAGRMDRHLGTNCQSCRVSPIEGKCYRCASCVDFHLCQSCFNTPIHTQHSFEYRHKRNQRWRVAQRTYGAVLPQAVVDDLLNRELSESDYDLLTQLDNNRSAPGSDIPESVINGFPLEKIREGSSSMLAPGIQCRMCLRGYELGQLVRKLPRCKHKFHKECIDNWLLHSHPTCPIDGNIVWDPSMEEEEEQQPINRSVKPKKDNSVQQARTLSLEIPGIGIARQSDNTGNQSASIQHSRRLGRLRQHNQRSELDTLRSSFALSGTALGYGDSDVGETTAASDLPGSRLLGRTQINRANLSQHLQNNTTSRYDNEPNRNDSDSVYTGATNSYSRNRLELQGSSVLPFDNRMYIPPEQTGSSGTSAAHDAIRNHLAHLSTNEEEANREPVNNLEERSRVSPHRHHSLRNALLSSTDIRSPLRELDPVLESEQENTDNGSEQHGNNRQMQNGTTTDSAHQTFFQRHPGLRFHSENEDNLSLSSSIASSARVSPEIREGSHKNIHRSNHGDAGPLVPEHGTSGQQEQDTIPSVSSAPSVLDRSRSTNERNVRNRPRSRSRENAPGRTRSNQNDSQSAVVPTREQPLSINPSNIMDRLQDLNVQREKMFTDLYLGNDPRGQNATTEHQRSNVRLPPRPPRRQIGDPIANARRRAQMMRRNSRKRDDISLEGSAFNNLTLRDIIH